MLHIVRRFRPTCCNHNTRIIRQFGVHFPRVATSWYNRTTMSTSFATGNDLLDSVVSPQDEYLRPVYRRVPALPGQSLDQVDTPALLLDLDAVDANIEECIRRLEEFPNVKIRPHVKTHKCPQLAQRQIERSRGRTHGVCCQKVIEAEAMVWGGIKDVFISNEVVGRSKLERVIRLAMEPHCAKVRVVFDSKENAQQLSNVMQEMTKESQQVTVEALVEMDVGQKRCGVSTPTEAVELAKHIQNLPSLKLCGIQAYHGAAQHIRSHADREKTIRQVVAKTTEAVRLFIEANLDCSVITGGGTGTYPLEAASVIFTEVQPGSYVVNDADYSRNLGQDGKQLWGRVDQGGWKHALFLYATVMSRNVKGGYVVLDLGLKGTSVDSGPPVLKEEGDALTREPVDGNQSRDARSTLEFGQLTDEHATVIINQKSKGFREAFERRINRGEDATELTRDLSWFSGDALPSLGEKVKLIPGHCDPCCNHHDFFAICKGEEVVDVWEISGRSPGF